MRWALGCGLRRGGGASVDGTEEGGGGNCCRCSGLGARAMAGAVKELILSLTETGWFSTDRQGLSFPRGATALGSVLADWTEGCEIGPTDC